MANPDGTPASHDAHDQGWQTLFAVQARNAPYDERSVADHVVMGVQRLGIAVAQSEQIRRALAKALRDTLEYNRILGLQGATIIRVLIPGEGRISSAAALDAVESPAVHGQLGEQSHHGWGFFLVRHQERQATTPSDEMVHVIEVYLYREGDRQ
jgi:hypothetical protein